MQSLSFVDGRFPESPRSLRQATGRLVVHVGVGRHPIRSQAVWPIGEVLEVEDELDALLAGTPEDQAAPTELLHDLLDSRMIAPLRPRRRRQRSVSSRAIFYQGPEKVDG
jgi:hypothetical protein